MEAKDADKQVESPCTSKNSLCVGASYNAPRLYQEQPSFVHSALQLGSDSCMGDSRSSCAEEVDSLPALFGATKPSEQTLVLCESVADDCLKFRAACPECAYNPAKLIEAVDAPVSETSPADACDPLRGFPRGQVCLVQRGTCSFLLKATFSLLNDGHLLNFFYFLCSMVLNHHVSSHLFKVFLPYLLTRTLLKDDANSLILIQPCGFWIFFPMTEWHQMLQSYYLRNSN